MANWKSLHADWSEQGDARVLVCHLSGFFTSSTESYAFLEALQEKVRNGQNRVVIDLAKVDAITSAGVGILAAAYTTVNKAEGKICFSRVPDRARSILNIVGLLALMGEGASEEEAVGRVSA